MSYLYLPHDRLSPAELSAARLDGDLFELGEGYIPADAVETPVLRAASLCRVTGRALAVVGCTAAWIHDALDVAPRAIEVQRAVARRISPPRDRRLLYRDLMLPPEEYVVLGEVPVMTPARTLADVARLAERDPLRRAAAESLAADTALLDAARTWWHAQGPRRDKRIALRWIARATTTS